MTHEEYLASTAALTIPNEAALDDDAPFQWPYFARGGADTNAAAPLGSRTNPIHPGDWANWECQVEGTEGWMPCRLPRSMNRPGWLYRPKAGYVYAIGKQ